MTLDYRRIHLQIGMTINPIYQQCHNSFVFRFFFRWFAKRRVGVYRVMLSVFSLECARMLLLVFFGNRDLNLYMFDFYAFLSDRLVVLAQLTPVFGFSGFMLSLTQMYKIYSKKHFYQWNRVFFEPSVEPLLSYYNVRSVVAFCAFCDRVGHFGNFCRCIFMVTHFWNIAMPCVYLYLLFNQHQLLLIVMITLPVAFCMILAINCVMLLFCTQLYFFYTYIQLLCFRIFEMNTLLRVQISKHYPENKTHQELNFKFSIKNFTPLSSYSQSSRNESLCSKESFDVKRRHQFSSHSLAYNVRYKNCKTMLLKSKINSLNGIFSTVSTLLSTPTTHREERRMSLNGLPEVCPSLDIKTLHNFITNRQQKLIGQTINKFGSLCKEVHSNQEFFSKVIGFPFVLLFFAVVTFNGIVMFDNWIVIWKRTLLIFSSFVLFFFSEGLPCLINRQLLASVSPKQYYFVNSVQ